MQHLLWWTRIEGNFALISSKKTTGTRRSCLPSVNAYWTVDLPTIYLPLFIWLNSTKTSIRKFFCKENWGYYRNRLDCHGTVNYHKPEMESNDSSFVHLTEFEMLTEQDVKSLVQLSSLKSCALDPMPSATFASRCIFPLSVLTSLITLKCSHSQVSFAITTPDPLLLVILIKKNVKKRRGLKFGTVSPRIWENSQSMLLKNKYINLLLLDLQRRFMLI